MQLYKSRGFSEFFQDTFAFLKANGKHFFKQYLIINGFFLIILMAMMYFFTKFYSSILFGGLGDNPNFMDDYMNQNWELFSVLFVLFIIIALIAGAISFAFVPLYLKLFSEREGQNFGTNDLVDAYKRNLGKIFIFLICGFLLGIPLAIVFGIGAFVLIITIIGMLLLPVLIGTFSLFYGMTLMEYLEQKRGIWDSFGYSWTLMSSKFWSAVGSVGLFFLMSYVVQSVLSLIPYIFGMASLFTIDTNTNEPNTMVSTMTIMMLVVFFVSFFLGVILGIIVQLNQGIVFYSLKEDLENINTKSVIDQIGSSD